MITSRRRKTLLVSAVLISISGFSVFAEAPQMAGSGNNMSQSSMVDVKKKVDRLQVKGKFPMK